MTALHIVEFADITNTGRVRRNNEDSYIVEPPLFVLADGMGGAQAGEVASRLTIEAFARFPGVDTVLGPDFILGNRTSALVRRQAHGAVLLVARVQEAVAQEAVVGMDQLVRQTDERRA